MIRIQSPKLKIQNSRGIALIFTILFTSVLLVIALSLTGLVISEVRQATDIEDSTQAFYSAESGVEFGLRYVLKGGIARKNTLGGSQYCNDVKLASLTTRNFSDGDVSWSNLSGRTVRRVVSGQDVYFMRLLATGTARGITRNVVVDFTPDCKWAYPGNPYGLTGCWGDANVRYNEDSEAALSCLVGP